MQNTASNWWWSKKIVLIVVLPVLAAVLGLVATHYVQKHFIADPPAKPRMLISSVDAYKRILADVERRDPQVRPRLRYLSLVHRYNEPNCSAAELEADRRAVREFVAILSPGKPAHLDSIDPEHLIFRIDLEDLDWDAATEWHSIISHYRYGLGFEGKEPLAKLRQQLAELTQDRIPVVRADWFVVALARPPLGGPSGIVRTPFKDLPESVRTLSSKYVAQTLNLASCARELGFDDDAITGLIRRNENLQQEFGLAPLLKEEHIRREWWESDRNFFSPYQELARQLKIGNPVRVQ